MIYKGKRSLIKCQVCLVKEITCGTIQGWATIKISNANKVTCTQIIPHYSTIQRCGTTQGNTAHKQIHFWYSNTYVTKQISKLFDQFQYKKLMHL